MTTTTIIWVIVTVVALLLGIGVLIVLERWQYRRYRRAQTDVAMLTHEVRALAGEVDTERRQNREQGELLAAAHAQLDRELRVNAQWTLRFDERVTQEAANLCGAIANGIWSKGDPTAPRDHTPAAVIEAGQVLVERDRDVRRALYAQEHPEYAAGITAEPAP